MANENSQSLTQRQTQRLATRLSQQQLRFVRLLELNAPEFEEAVDQELQSNPALEALPEGETISQTSNSNKEEEEWTRPAWRVPGSSSSSISFQELPPPEDSPSLYDYLNSQLPEKSLTDNQLKAARFIIGSLDPNGYLRTPLNQIALDMAVNEDTDLPESDWQIALQAIKELDPPGMGAVNLQESLQLQLQRLPDSQDKEVALRIIKNHFDTFVLKHFDRIASSLKLPVKTVQQAIDLIVQLNPKPGAQFEARSSEAANYVVPDFILEETDNGLTISLANRVPELAIEQSFAKAVADSKTEPGNRRKKGMEFVASRVSEARDFIKLLSQRQHTLLQVASAILKIQKEYFETRDLYRLRPMMLKDIMAITGFDASVVSRATAGKYLQTPWGIFPMRFFFSDTVGENGADTGALTNRKLEAEIKSLIENEDKKHPLSDDKLQQAMAERGYDISRRTVAKYRDRLKIPVARLRRE